MHGRGRDEEGEDTRTCMGGAGMRRGRTHVHAWAGQGCQDECEVREIAGAQKCPSANFGRPTRVHHAN